MILVIYMLEVLLSLLLMLAISNEFQKMEVNTITSLRSLREEGFYQPGGSSLDL